MVIDGRESVTDEPEVETIANQLSSDKAPTKLKKREDPTDDSKEVINLFGSKPSFKMPAEETSAWIMPWISCFTQRPSMNGKVQALIFRPAGSRKSGRTVTQKSRKIHVMGSP